MFHPLHIYVCVVDAGVLSLPLECVGRPRAAEECPRQRGRHGQQGAVRHRLHARLEGWYVTQANTIFLFKKFANN